MLSPSIGVLLLAGRAAMEFAIELWTPLVEIVLLLIELGLDLVRAGALTLQIEVCGKACVLYAWSCCHNSTPSAVFRSASPAALRFACPAESRFVYLLEF